MNEVGIKITALDATGNAFNSVLGKLSDLKNEAGGVGETIGGLVGKFNALGLAIGGAMSVASIKGAIDTGDEFNKLAQKTGVAVESLRELNYAAGLAGVETDALGTGLRKLSINMAGAAGGGKAQQDIFNALGLSVKDATGNLKSADAMLTEVAGKFSNFTDGPEKAALAVQLFGKSGADLIPLLNAGATGLNDMAQEARDLGTVFSADFAKNSEAFNDNLERLGVLSKSAASAVASQLLPTMNMLAEAYLKAQKEGTGFTSVIGTGLNAMLVGAVTVFKAVEFAINSVGKAIGSVVAQFSALGENGGIFSAKGRAAWDAVRVEFNKDIAADLEAYKKSLYDIGHAAQLTSKAGAGRGTGTDPRLLGSTQTSAPIVGSGTATTISEATKGLELYNSLMDQAAGFEKTWAEDANKLRAALDGKKISQDQFNESVNALLKKQPLMVEAAKLEAEWQKEVIKSNEDVAKTRDDSLKSIQSELDKQKEQNAAIGLTAVAIAELEAAKLTDLAIDKDRLGALADLIDFSGALGQKYRDEAAVLRELASAKVSGAVKKESYDAAQDMLKEQKKAAEESGKYWEDALMRAFESGKGFFQSLWDTIKNTLKTQVLKVAISATGLTGMSAASASESALSSFGSSALGSTFSNYFPAASAALSTVSNAAIASLQSIVGMTGTTAQAATAAANGLAFGTTGSASMAATIGSYVPYIAAAVIAYQLINGNNTKSTSATGSAQSTYGAGGTFLSKAAGPSGVDNAAAEKLVASLELSYLSTAQALGIAAGKAVFGYGGNTGKQGENPQLIVTGQVGNSSFNSGEVAVSDANYQLAASRAVLAALKGSDLPKYLSGVFDNITASTATQAQIDATLGAATALANFNKQLTGLPGALGQLADLSYTATQGLIAASGGLDALATNLGTYYTNFYSAEEQRAQTIANINKATAGSGLDAATATRESFRALVESQDLTTTSGQQTYAALISVAGAFAGLNPVLAATAAAVDTALESLKKDASSLAVDLLTARGDTTGAAAARRAIDTAGYSAEATAQYDANVATRALIASLNEQAAATIAAADAAKALAATNKGWQDQLDVLTGVQTDRSIALRDTTDESTRALMRQVYAQQDLKLAAEALAAAAAAAANTVKDARASLLSSVTQGASDAYAGLQRAVSAQKAIEQADYEAQKAIATAAFTSQQAVMQASIDSTSASLDAVGVSVGKLQSLSNSLKSTLDGMRITGSESTYRSDAQAQISAALATARAGGGLPMDGQLTSALATVSKPSEQLFSTFEAYSRDFYKTANDLSSLSGLTDAQLTADEITQGVLRSQLTAQQDQVKQLKDGFAAQVSTLDSILENAKNQLDAANGINTAVLSVADALAVFNTAISNLATVRATQNLPTTAGVTGAGVGMSASARNDIIHTYMQGLADNPNLSMLDKAVVLAAKAHEVGVSEAEIAKAWGASATDTRAFFAAAGVPQFAVGTNYVPQDMLAQIHQGEAIIPRAYNPAAGGQNSDALVAEIKALRDEVRSLKASNETTAASTKKMAAQFETVTEGGRAMLTEVYA